MCNASSIVGKIYYVCCIKKIFQVLAKATNLKTLRYDGTIRHQSALKHNSYTMLQEPILSPLLPKNTEIFAYLLEKCSKKEHEDDFKSKRWIRFDCFDFNGTKARHG